MNPQDDPIAVDVTSDTTPAVSPTAPMQNGTTVAPNPDAARIQVAKKYCRVLTAIDDEIFQKVIYKPDDHEGLIISSRFNELRQSCEDNDMFCHLLHFPRSDHSTDIYHAETQKYLRRAVNSAREADVVVLDWHLAHASNPTNALYILDQLTQGEPRIQFVMVYTEQQNLQDIANQIRDSFQDRKLTLQDLYSPATPDFADADELVSGAPNPSEAERFGFHLDQKLFIFLAAKAEVHADQVMEFIYDVLVRFLPDRLQWAGLELMGRARDILPKVVAALPTGTNPALQGQILFQGEDEVAFQVADSLLDELRHALLEQPLQVVSDVELFEDIRFRMKGLLDNTANWKGVADKISPGVAGNIENLRKKKEQNKVLTPDDIDTLNKFEAFQSQWQNNNLQELREDVGAGQSRASKHYFPQNKKKHLALCIGHFLAAEKEEIEIVQGHIAWAQVRESVLLTERIKMRPGAVLQKIKEESHPDAPEWLFCQTGACDCYRPHGHGFLFIVGRTQSGAESKLSETQSCVLGQEIVWDASQMMVLPDPTDKNVPIHGLQDQKLKDGEAGEAKEPEKAARYRIVGALRTEFTARVIQRVFTHQGRIGVDTCELMRVRRGE